MTALCDPRSRRRIAAAWRQRVETMDIRQLELFLSVLEHNSVTRAAKQAGLSAAAVSLRLHKLAADLRTELFARSGSKFIPTPAGERLAEHAREVVRRVRQIEQEFANDPSGDVRPFHFATGTTTLIHRLRRPLTLLRKKYPNTPIRVTVAPTEEMVRGLLDRRFDLALISLPYNEEHLTIFPLFEEELLVLRPSTSRVRGWHVGSFDPAELATAPFILYPQRSNMRSVVLDGWFRRIGVTPSVIMEAEDTEVIKRLVEAGFGYSVLPEGALHTQPRFFHVGRIPKDRLVRCQALAMARSEHARALTVSIAHFLMGALSGPLSKP